MARRPVARSRRHGLVLLALAALGAYVAYWRLGVAGWGVDEVTYAEAAEAYMDGDFSLNRGHAWLAKELIGLSMTAFGPTEIGVRLPGATLGFATGFLLYLLGRRIAGSVAGLAAAALWWLLPQAPGVHPIRLDRYGMLEPPMVFFAVAALLLAWCWGETGRWPWIVAAGVALGLSASSKFTGALFAPAVALPILWAPLTARRRVLQGIAAAGAAVAGLVAPYLAEGFAGVDALREGIALQFENNAAGHLQIVAGTLYENPPWWSHLWWQGEYLTLLGVAAFWLLAAAGLAVAGKGGADGSASWRVRLFLLGAAAAPTMSLVASPRKLPHYHLVLVPVLAVAVGLLAASLAGRRRRLVLLGAAAPVAVLSAVAVLNLARVTTLEADAYRLAAQRLEGEGVGGRVLVFGWAHVLQAEMPQVEALDAPPGQPPEVMIVDPVTRDRFRGTDLDRYVSSMAPGYDRSRAGRLTVYVRKDL